VVRINPAFGEEIEKKGSLSKIIGEGIMRKEFHFYLPLF